MSVNMSTRITSRWKTSNHIHITINIIIRLFLYFREFSFFSWQLLFLCCLCFCVSFLHKVVNWGGVCIRSSGVDDEVVGSCLSWWVLQLAVIAAILETAVSTVKCSSDSVKKESNETCYHSITLHFILNESGKAVRCTSSGLIIAKKVIKTQFTFHLKYYNDYLTFLNLF